MTSFNLNFGVRDQTASRFLVPNETMKHTHLFIVAALLLTPLSSLRGAELQLHVSPNGTDTNSGTQTAPVATLAQAQKLARAASGLGKAVTVMVHDGIYYLPQPLVFDATDSGSAQAPVLYQASPGEHPIFSAGIALTNLDWKPYRDGILQTQVPVDLQTDQLFVNGERQILARYPNVDPKQLILNGSAADAISPERVAKWSDPSGGYFHTMHPALWGGFSYLITGKDSQGHLLLEGGWQNNRPGSAAGKFTGEPKGIHQKYRMVENIFEELDSPGEWFLNTKTHTLYYYPPAGVDLHKASVEAPVLKSLVEFRGTQQAPVRFVTLKGITFRHTLRTFMENREKLIRTDWTVYRGGALFFQGAEDCSIEDSLFDQVGGNAVFVSHYNLRITIKGSEIVNAGGNGIAFVGDPAAARSALTGYESRQNYQDIDPTPGPQSDNYPKDCLVDDCLIHGTGCIEKQTAGVEIDLAQDITVRHCSIYDVSRSGINIGDGCWGGHVIEGCDIFDTVKETGDHGSFNSWGRDRYWGAKGVPSEKLPAFALLDVVKPITLRFNRWRCDHGWDVDLDDGSSNYEIHDNLFLNGGIKLREGYCRKVTNNITVNNSLHPHCWFPNSGDVVTGNIWMGPYRPAGAMTQEPWGTELDRNLFATTEADRTKFARYGCDSNSLVGDPMFRDPSKGDYSVREGSPALKVGFKNFPMDQFGVQKPALKVKSRTPELPKVKFAGTSGLKSTVSVRSWMGLQIKEMEGEEYSAYGVAKDSGGVEIVEGNHPLLQKGDLIQMLNGRPVKNCADLEKAALTHPMSVGIIRSQQPQQVNLP
jgi:hypothetical protein